MQGLDPGKEFRVFPQELVVMVGTGTPHCTSLLPGPRDVL